MTNDSLYKKQRLNAIFLVAGRVHYAMVSKVNAASRSVTVEWYERGETKGKEVEMDALLQLNPGVCNITEPPTIISTATQPANLQRVSTLSVVLSGGVVK